MSASQGMIHGFKVSNCHPEQPEFSCLESTELDMDTFEVMWNLSAPGGGADGCFLRLKQSEFRYEKSTNWTDALSKMPDVINLAGFHQRFY